MPPKSPARTSLPTPTPTPGEQEFQQRLRLALRAAVPSVRLWRQPAGRIRTDRGTWVECAPVGAADLSGIISGPGWRLEVEVKGAKTRTEPEQTRWLEAMRAHGAVALLVRYDASVTLEENVARACGEIAEAIQARRTRP